MKNNQKIWCSVFALCLFFLSTTTLANIQPAKTAPIAAKKIPPKAPAPPKPEVFDLEKVINGVQAYYQKITSSQFFFEQTYTLFGKSEKFEGQALFKPKKMYWNYQKPENKKKEFYISENKFTYLMTNDKIAYTHDCFSGDALSFAISFLWGKGNLKTSFTIKKNADETLNKNLFWLLLEPKEKNSAVTSIALGVNKKTYLVEETILYDATKGKNYFKFTQVKTNLPIKEDSFIYKPKEGIKVMPMPGVVCPKKEPAKTPPATPPVTKTNAVEKKVITQPKTGK